MTPTITFPEAVVANIRHGPSSHFLHHIGIPSHPNPWFDLVDGTPEQARKVGSCYDDLRERWANLPEGAESWLLLGMVSYDDIALDGIAGVVYCLPGDETEIYPLNKDLNSFAHFLHLLEKERPNYDFESEQETL
ncbi:SUKH-4 family immunity protein, partial [Streptomyces sp. 4F14]|uniref:SUKH-4 family immunity protein n=1 Tax=Streptomyces sp. 4F14 TaxID=3394380 RepID=UPI003A84EC08